MGELAFCVPLAHLVSLLELRVLRVLRPQRQVLVRQVFYFPHQNLHQLVDVGMQVVQVAEPHYLLVDYPRTFRLISQHVPQLHASVF
jgi:hypothetical protein